MRGWLSEVSGVRLVKQLAESSKARFQPVSLVPLNHSIAGILSSHPSAAEALHPPPHNCSTTKGSISSPTPPWTSITPPLSSPYYVPDTRLQVFTKELHVHSSVLKQQSASSTTSWTPLISPQLPRDLRRLHPL